MLKSQNITFSYLHDITIDAVSFTLQKGATMAIIGESGCGKSTLLKLIYGLYDLDEGHIFWKDTEVLGPKFHLVPGMDFMKYLAQDFDLMPFTTVGENVGKYLSNFYPEQKKERIAELLEIVEMSEFAHVKAKFLSGGQMQRVAIARVLALEPEVLLLDEPFSHIDNFRKNGLRRKLLRYVKEKNITTLIATHDSTDVLSFADEVMVLQQGKILQSGTPESIYNFPNNYYVASLFGDVNQIEINGVQTFVYPHQFKIVEHSDIEVKVMHCYYRGSTYLIETHYNNQVLFLENPTPLVAGKSLYVTYTKSCPK